MPRDYNDFNFYDFSCSEFTVINSLKVLAAGSRSSNKTMNGIILFLTHKQLCFVLYLILIYSHNLSET